MELSNFLRGKIAFRHKLQHLGAPWCTSAKICKWWCCAWLGGIPPISDIWKLKTYKLNTPKISETLRLSIFAPQNICRKSAWVATKGILQHLCIRGAFKKIGKSWDFFPTVPPPLGTLTKMKKKLCLFGVSDYFKHNIFSWECIFHQNASLIFVLFFSTDTIFG